MLEIKTKRKSTTDIIYESLKEAIIKFDFLPGTKLVEQDLSKKLQISRTPLREALKLLEFEGFVTRKLNGGLEVSKLSIKELQDIYELKIAIESIAVKSIAENWHGSDLNELENIVNKIQLELKRTSKKENRYSENSVLWGLEKLNLDFHFELINIYGNQIFIEMLKRIHGRFSRYTYICYKNNKERFIKLLYEHLKIYELIKKRKSNEAVKMIKEHIIRAEEKIINELAVRQKEEEWPGFDISEFDLQ